MMTLAIAISGAEQMCRFTRDEFFRGMRELGTDTIIGIQTRLPELTAEVTSDSSKFKDLYRLVESDEHTHTLSTWVVIN